MKVALIISGQARFLKECSELIKKHIINPYSADVFIHTWKSWRYKFAPRKKKPKIISGVATFESLKTYYPVTDFIIEDQIDEYNSPKWSEAKFNGKVKRNYPHFVSPCSMFYSTYRANELKKKHEEINGKYDVVIKARFDLIVPVPVSLNIVKQGEKAIWHGATYFGPMSDQMGFGNSESMDIYCDAYKHIWEMLEAHNDKTNNFTAPHGLHPETFLYHYLTKNQIKVSQMLLWHKLGLKRP